MKPDSGVVDSVPRFLLEIQVRVGQTGLWLAIRTPNVPVRELIEDFVPLMPRVESNRRIGRITIVDGVDVPFLIDDWDRLIGDLRQQANGNLRLEFHDR